ncbi:hypothetical protein PV08_00187 [Exophiala spinifera]|uniref:Zn(2)-C6 fungal-type domain-containing protein n=1 Tax=Exophiala spinifera TaxID=91928 RepID=A0A0D2C7S1_9EURO|nr:uncharacterized protein PV08_00187 [Exophiala spinifera]KIW19614.1 hypothetical protein PV08_00187 [Exophiala spinifera]
MSPEDISAAIELRDIMSMELIIIGGFGLCFSFPGFCMMRWIRKVKCDEAKPHCARCTSTGRRCDGYLSKPRAGLSLHESCRLTKNGGRDGEARAFDFFRHVAGPALSGQFDAYFWTNMVTQVSHREPAVRHAVMALSSLYEQFQDMNKSPLLASINRFAVHHYNSAIKELLSARDDAVVLLVCALFICVEFLQGNKESAIEHCRNGILILNKAAPSLSLRHDYLPLIFCRLSIFPLFFGCSVSSFPYVAGLDAKAQHHFSKIADAQCSLDVLLSESIRFIRSTEDYRLGTLRHTAVPSSIREKQDCLERSLSAWFYAFSEFHAAQPPSDSRAVRYHLLQMRYLVTQIWVNVALEQNETAYDRHLDQFRSIVHIASQVVLPGSRDHSLRPKFICEMGFTPLLYFVVMKCRSLPTRLTALSLMKELGISRENLWDLNTMYCVGRRLVEMEHDITLSEITVQSSLRRYAEVPLEERRIREVMLDPGVDIRQDNEGHEVVWTQMHSMLWKPVGDLVMKSEWMVIS